MKRFNCTSRDIRGFDGESMEIHKQGKYIKYASHVHFCKELRAKLEKERDEALKEVNSLRQRVKALEVHND